MSPLAGVLSWLYLHNIASSAKNIHAGPLNSALQTRQRGTQYCTIDELFSQNTADRHSALHTKIMNSTDKAFIYSPWLLCSIEQTAHNATGFPAGPIATKQLADTLSVASR